jgi:cytochrome c553
MQLSRRPVPRQGDAALCIDAGVSSHDRQREDIMKFVLLAMTFAAAATGAGTAAAQSPDANLARNIAASCANCHGTDGRSRGIVPGLAGREKASIVLQVQEFRDGKRPSMIMQQLAKGYTDAQIEAAAAYFAAQKP